MASRETTLSWVKARASGTDPTWSVAPTDVEPVASGCFMVVDMVVLLRLFASRSAVASVSVGVMS